MTLCTMFIASPNSINDVSQQFDVEKALQKIEQNTAHLNYLKDWIKVDKTIAQQKQSQLTFRVESTWVAR